MTDARIKLITDSDLDGISCAVLANVAYGDNVDATFCTPKDVDYVITEFINSEEYKKYNKVFITDLVIKEETAALIDSVYNYDFKLIDHHKSNYTNSKYQWADIRESIKGVKTCGTELFWKYLREHRMSFEYEEDYDAILRYVEFVRLWDTWDWVNAKAMGILARDLNTLSNIYSKSKFVSKYTKLLLENDYVFINDLDQDIIDNEELRKTRYIKQKTNNVKILKLKDYNIAYCFAENYISELGNYIMKNVKDIKYAALINPDIGVVSLRSIDDCNINVAEVAKSLGIKGGGHPLSAGFVYDEEFNKSLINKIFKVE